MTNSHPTLGYFVPEFPGQTHVFFWRELLAIRANARPAKLISTRKGDLSQVKHDFAIPASKETFYLHPPGPSALIFALLNPSWLLRAARYVAQLNEGGVKEKLRTAYFVVLAANLIHFCRKHSIQHIHGHSCANAAHILALASLFGALSFSLTLHGGLSVYGKNHRQKFRHAKFVATVTKPLQQEVHEKTGLPISKIPVITMGVDLNKFNYLENTQDPTQPLRLVTVARLATGKGHSFALRALHRLHKKGIAFQYTIVGGGDAKKAIEAEIKNYGLENKVTMTGTLDEDGVLQALRNSDILLLTSFGAFEAAPVCVMEAMALGKPSITSIIGGTGDMIDHGKNGFLVKQQDVDQIEEALMRFISDRSLVTLFGASARQKAERDFGADSQANKLLAEIDKKS